MEKWAKEIWEKIKKWESGTIEIGNDLKIEMSTEGKEYKLWIDVFRDGKLIDSGWYRKDEDYKDIFIDVMSMIGKHLLIEDLIKIKDKGKYEGWYKNKWETFVWGNIRIAFRDYTCERLYNDDMKSIRMAIKDGITVGIFIVKNRYIKLWDFVMNRDHHIDLATYKGNGEIEDLIRKLILNERVGD